MKKEVDRISAAPTKRVFLSIIADYDLNRSICELIDNALDIWVRDGSRNPLVVKIELEKDQQTIHVIDNAGGVNKNELTFVVGPGQTGNLPSEEIIGIFGVGTKRAVVALAEDITITTRYKDDKTYQVELDAAWLQSEDWDLLVYEVPDIDQGTTVINLQSLRVQITEESISQLKQHLNATYAYFLNDPRITIKVNSDQLEPITFEDWAYPPKFPPHKYVGSISSEDGGIVKVEVLAGLTKESSPAGGEYGVYFYCNKRLIARGLKNYDVGFTKGLAGKPHPSMSLTRVIVSLNGPAQLMPWNSSKSGINPNHKVFIALRNFLVQVVKDWASLSRRWVSQWSEEVFKYDSGNIKVVNITNFPDAKKSYLPQLPKLRHRYGDLVLQVNRIIAKDKPWTTGLYESVVAIDLISKQKLREKNRICLILLDSTLEIAFKEYLVYESGQPYNDNKLINLFKNRNEVEKEVQKYIQFPLSLWQKINYFYGIRCKLVHERTTIGISDEQLAEYRETVQNILKDLFGLCF
jgi:hypothetical protein